MKGNDEATAALLRLQAWYQAECNGDWEHTYGFKLETLDNPGWAFEADLEETKWAGTEVPMTKLVRCESDWTHYEIKDNKYLAAGGSGNLIEMLEQFFSVLEDLQLGRKQVV